MQLHVLFCLDFGGDDRSNRNAAFNGQLERPDASVQLRCLGALIMSLVKALGSGVVADVHLEVIRSPLDQVDTDALGALLRRCPFAANEVSAAADVEVDVVELAGSRSFDFIYLVASDCLHAPDSIEEMIFEYRHMTSINNEDLIVTPYDHLLIYKDQVTSLILAGQRRYWRTSPVHTRTVLMSQRAFAGCQDALRRMRSSGEGLPLTCLSPMPALAAALTAPYPPPFAPWQSWLRTGLST
jgi:hypothetical protein